MGSTFQHPQASEIATNFLFPPSSYTSTQPSTSYIKIASNDWPMGKGIVLGNGCPQVSKRAMDFTLEKRRRQYNNILNLNIYLQKNKKKHHPIQTIMMAQTILLLQVLKELNAFCTTTPVQKRQSRTKQNKEYKTWSLQTKLYFQSMKNQAS